MDSSEHSPDASVTSLLLRWRRGDQTAEHRLVSLLYEQMQRLARHELRRERVGHTLQSRDLVHEAYERLVKADIDWNDRAHFLAIAARTMRRILVDHARARRAQKRDAGSTLIRLDALTQPVQATSPRTDAFDLLMVDEALSKLGQIDSRMERTVEFYFFGDMTHEEVAEAIGSSRATVQRDLRFARAWLRRHLENN